MGWAVEGAMGAGIGAEPADAGYSTEEGITGIPGVEEGGADATADTASFFSMMGGTSRGASRLEGATEEGAPTNDCICFSICW